MFMGHDSERSAVPFLLEQADVGGIQMLLGHSKLDTTELLTRVATFPLATKAGETGVITWTVNQR
jgi:site-specific recombinase XerC